MSCAEQRKGHTPRTRGPYLELGGAKKKKYPPRRETYESRKRRGKHCFLDAGVSCSCEDKSKAFYKF